MKVAMMLADAAQAAEGKLYVLGGGWSVTGPEPSPFAIAMLVEVPWDLCNAKHKLRLELIDSDGEPVVVPTAAGEEPLFVEADFEVGRPPGVKPGTPMTMPVPINMGPQPIPPGGRYEWRLTIDGQAEEGWTLPFSTRPAAGQEVA
jgi:hypothetical protein